MKILLIISIFVFCFLVGKINKKNPNNSLYIALATIFTPVIFLNKINIPIFIAFITSFLFLFIFDLTKNKFFKKILFTVTLIYFSFTILYLSGILNSGLKIDYQKLLVVDNSNLETIKRFQLDALYLPKILRPIIYNYFQIIFVIFTRALNYLWLDKIISYLGFTFIYLIYLAFIQKRNWYYLIFPIIVILSGILHRDPNNQFIFLFCLPAFLIFFIKNIKKINTPFLFITILINCLYSFL
jgi:hypothetical protein